MQKRTEIQDLVDVLHDDIDCWNRYPKYRWVYDMSRLLDAQNIKWSPFGSLPMMIANMYFHTDKEVAYVPAYIYINKPEGKQYVTEVYIAKGEIKHMRCVCKLVQQVVTEDVGSVELRINAFVAIHFRKFTGVISVETVGSDIYSIRLRPISEFPLINSPEISKLLKRIYKKNDLVHLTGLTDHLLHETIAS